MKINKKLAIAMAKQATDVAIRNSEIVQPYIKHSHYRRLLLGLNALHLALRMAKKGE